MAVKPLSTGQRIANLVFGPPPGSKVRMPDGTSWTLQYGVPASGVVGLGRLVAGAGVRGLANQVRNAVTRQEVVVHGSQYRGLSQISPRAGSKDLPESSVVFGWRPSEMSPSDLAANAARFTGRGGEIPGTSIRVSKDMPNVGSGSVYVARVPKRGISEIDRTMPPEVVTSIRPAKVVGEIPVTPKVGIAEEISPALQAMLRRAGARMPRGTR